MLNFRGGYNCLHLGHILDLHPNFMVKSSSMSIFMAFWISTTRLIGGHVDHSHTHHYPRNPKANSKHTNSSKKKYLKISSTIMNDWIYKQRNNYYSEILERNMWFALPCPPDRKVTSGWEACRTLLALWLCFRIMPETTVARDSGGISSVSLSSMHFSKRSWFAGLISCNCCRAKNTIASFMSIAAMARLKSCTSWHFKLASSKSLDLLKVLGKS